MKTNYHHFTILIFIWFIHISCTSQNTGDSSIKDRIIEEESQKLIELADAFLSELPITITASRCDRSAGGIHDYYSEGTYWWPDPSTPEGPYIRKDGLVNPDNFNDHLNALQRFSLITGTLSSAYLLTGKIKYAEKASMHIKAWFIDPATRMNPHLLYAQAISGITEGRGIGIIDTVHLIDVAQSAKLLANTPFFSAEEIEEIKAWFSDYISWLKTHPNGVEEMNWRNNHGTWWHTQVAAFASFTGDVETLEFCRDRFKHILIPNQMAEDGSFPLELERTRPFAYSLFNIDGMVLLTHILAEKEEKIWYFDLDDGRGVIKAIDFIAQYTEDKSRWPYPIDLDYWDELPNRRPFLLLASNALQITDLFEIWKNIPDRELSEEGLRNLPLKNILLWL